VADRHPLETQMQSVGARESRNEGKKTWGVLPYMGYIGLRDAKGYDFSAVLVINRVWFLLSSLDVGKKPLFIIIENKINKSASQIIFTVI